MIRCSDCAQVYKRRAQHFCRRVEHRDAAVLNFDTTAGSKIMRSESTGALGMRSRMLATLYPGPEVIHI